MNGTNGEFYNKPAWPGALFMERDKVLLNRALYVCYAGNTTLHALPVPQIYIPLTAGLRVQVEAWAEKTGAGEGRCVPSKNERKQGVNWKPRKRTVELEPGQLTLVMSDYEHQLLGEGVIAIIYLLPDGEAAQWALTRADYDTGLAVITPRRPEMDYLLWRLCEHHADP
ncbi:MAG TPA: hypothetical protein VF611_06605, partial [Pyrinomonadaceae bacterium]